MEIEELIVLIKQTAELAGEEPSVTLDKLRRRMTSPKKNELVCGAVKDAVRAVERSGENEQ